MVSKSTEPACRQPLPMSAGLQRLDTPFPLETCLEAPSAKLGNCISICVVLPFSCGVSALPLAHAASDAASCAVPAPFEAAWPLNADALLASISAPPGTLDSPF
eukprot:6213707-Pleurochrysis_carterae.AAC.1